MRRSQKGSHTFLIQISTGRRYWMFVKIRASATLKTLDDLLRDIWLNDGHASEFQIGYEIYASDDWGGGAKDMSAKLKDVLEGGLRFKMDYDYGSTTTLRFVVVSDNKKDMTVMKKSAKVLIRNMSGNFKCHVCKSVATETYVDTSYGERFVCDKCSEKLDSNCVVFPIENTPRMGM